MLGSDTGTNRCFGGSYTKTTQNLWLHLDSMVRASRLAHIARMHVKVRGQQRPLAFDSRMEPERRATLRSLLKQCQRLT
jgi:hypothetical protein